jgi:thioesterase domain-containing protein
MEEASFGVRDERMVLLKVGRDRHKHLFLVHDVTGEVDGYIQFSRYLENDFNVWGIRAKRERSTDSITIIARQYIEKIKRIQEHGPYFIAGWSLGGTIVFEMVRQLETTGEKTSFVCLIDSPGPGLNKEMKRDQEEIVEQLKAFEGQYDEKAEGENLIPVIRWLIDLRNRYIPENKIKADVEVFHATGSNLRRKKLWNDWVEGKLKIHEIEGDHFSIFQNPLVKNFAQKFNRLLEKESESVGLK